jgi:polysaccharide export outer membrane protein
MKSSITQTQTSLRRLIAYGAASTVLSGCALAPGMNINWNEPDMVLNTAETAEQKEPQVPINEIDIALLRR